MIDVTIIMPLKKLNKADEKHFTKAITSIENLREKDNVGLLLVGPSKILEKAEEIFKKTKSKISYELLPIEDTNIAVQINQAALSCASKYFSVMEITDTYTNNWLTSIEPFMKANLSKSVYLTVIGVVNSDGKQEYFGNEMGWNPSYVNDNLGQITEEAIKAYPDFIFHGGLINTADFLSVHGLKASMKIVMWYEFALRLLRKGKEIYVVPKIGYLHIPLQISEKEISMEEGRWLVETADEESHFDEDRGLKFEKTEGK